MSKTNMDNRILTNKLLTWIVSNRDQFSHLHGKYPEERLKLLKPIGELALCCDIMIRMRVLVNEAKSLIEWAWNELDHGEFLLKALISRPSLLMIFSLYATFYRNGFFNERLHNLVSYYSKSSFTKSMQYPYWRRLDLELALFSIGVVDSFNPKEELTWSFHQPEPWMIDNDSAYALTHEVFYLTDFGLNGTHLSKYTKSYISDWIPTWLKIFLMDSNLDIYSELLMVSACIRKMDHYEEGTTVISEEINNSGCVRGPDGGGKNLVGENESMERIFFLNNYHTTLVSMMALCMREMV